VDAGDDGNGDQYLRCFTGVALRSRHRIGLALLFSLQP